MCSSDLVQFVGVVKGYRIDPSFGCVSEKGNCFARICIDYIGRINTSDVEYLSNFIIGSTIEPGS